MTALPRPLVALGLRLVTAGGLVVDAVVHLDIASSQPPGGPGQLDQSTLFRLESIAAILAALAILVLNSIWTSALALLVAVSAFAAVMVSVYVDLGSVGPIPDLYEPAWYATKTTCALSEAIATLTAAALVATAVHRRRRRIQDPRQRQGRPRADVAALTSD